MAKKKTAKKAAVKTGRLKTPVVTTIKKKSGKYDMAELMREMRKDQEDRKAASKKEIGSVAEELFVLGVKTATLAYNGEGDSGDISWLDYEKINDKPIPDALGERLKNAVWSLLPSGFENEDGGFGEVHIDTTTKKMRVEHSQRIVETSNTEYEFDL